MKRVSEPLKQVTETAESLLERRASLKIGEVSRRSGVGIEALRFYEKLGLLGAPARTASGYNAIGIPIAAGLLYPMTGWLLSPIIASAAMSMSSVSVVTNSLRLRCFTLV